MTDSQTRLLIKNGTLIDGSGHNPVPNTLIVVQGNRIAHVGPADRSIRPESPDDTVIDAAGKFILPGLIDAHCHISLHQGALPGAKYTSSAEFCTLWAARAIGRVLRAGVTSIAVPGGKWFTDVSVREAVEGGLLEGPRMVVAGRALSNYGGIFDPDPYPAFEGAPNDSAGVLCNTRDEFVRETRRQCKRGVDLIKIADSTWGDVQTVADDEIAAVVDEAHRRNVKVTIHSRGSTSTRAAAKAGVDLIYHGDLATEDDLDIIARAGMPIAPVLTSPWIGVEQGAAARGFTDRVRDRLKAQLDASFQMIRNARARGIAVLSGSDTGNASAFAHGRWHGKEAELFVTEIGMSPMEAILANTSGNAAMVNLAGEVGVIAPGKLADIVIWDSDPIADITVLQRPDEISAIIKDGMIIDRETVGGFRQLSEEPGRS
ncbi:MAG: amidohydrolase family protein, partial [Alphaproteobacteria bacterium]|nr:amidohydrolase family protein [Alphaproteobacteria bacterium]